LPAHNLGGYFAHWLRIGDSTAAENLPKLFWVNWFRKADDGSFLWPGFGDNSRVLKWVLERVSGAGEYDDTPIGRVPTAGALDTSGLELGDAVVQELVSVDAENWRQELPQIEAHYDRL